MGSMFAPVLSYYDKLTLRAARVLQKNMIEKRKEMCRGLHKNGSERLVSILQSSKAGKR